MGNKSDMSIHTIDTLSNCCKSRVVCYFDHNGVNGFCFVCKKAVMKICSLTLEVEWLDERSRSLELTSVYITSKFRKLFTEIAE